MKLIDLFGRITVWCDELERSGWPVFEYCTDDERETGREDFKTCFDLFIANIREQCDDEENERLDTLDINTKEELEDELSEDNDCGWLQTIITAGWATHQGAFLGEEERFYTDDFYDWIIEFDGDGFHTKIDYNCDIDYD